MAGGEHETGDTHRADGCLIGWESGTHRWKAAHFRSSGAVLARSAPGGTVAFADNFYYHLINSACSFSPHLFPLFSVLLDIEQSGCTVRGFYSHPTMATPPRRRPASTAACARPREAPLWTLTALLQHRIDIATASCHLSCPRCISRTVPALIPSRGGGGGAGVPSMTQVDPNINSQARTIPPGFDHADPDIERPRQGLDGTVIGGHGGTVTGGDDDAPIGGGSTDNRIKSAP